MIILYTEQFRINAITTDSFICFGPNHAGSMAEWGSFNKIVFGRETVAPGTYLKIPLIIKINHRSTDYCNLRMLIKKFYFFLKTNGQRNIIPIHSGYELGINILQAMIKGIIEPHITIISYEYKFLGESFYITFRHLNSVVA